MDHGVLHSTALVRRSSTSLGVAQDANGTFVVADYAETADTLGEFVANARPPTS